MPQPDIHVAVAVIINPRGEVLTSLRAPHRHQGGKWEFPGGKLESGESVGQALEREIREELGLVIEDDQPLITLSHAYPDKTVCLHVHVVSAFRNLPGVHIQTDSCSREGQPLRWQAIDDLQAADFPVANRAILDALRLPDEYLISAACQEPGQLLQKLRKHLETGCKLVQWRPVFAPVGDADKHRTVVDTVLADALPLCRQHRAVLMLNVPGIDWPGRIGTNHHQHTGVHFNRHQLMQLDDRSIERHRSFRWLSASCHDSREIRQANRLGLDFIVLSPVLQTASHPDDPPLGWPAFADLCRQAAMPVYALGGMTRQHITTARQHGARGIAGIGYRW